MEQVDEIQALSSPNLRAKRLPEQWRVVIEAQRGSGLGVEAYCRQQQITPSCFYLWRRFLSQTTGAASPWMGQKRWRQSISSVGLAPAIEGFAAVRVAAQTNAPRTLGDESNRLSLSGGRELILPVSMPVQWLAELLMALELSGPEREV